MADQKIFEELSPRTRNLLRGTEGLMVDFKRNPQSVSGDDLVSFANSTKGGTLLLGIDDKEGDNGQQVSHIVGCEISDGMKLLLTNKAFSCFPPVPIEIFIENNATRPFYRVEIASGANKPYCTAGGTYKTREDGRNKVLHPDELLELFVDAASQQFTERFRRVVSSSAASDTQSLKREIATLREAVEALTKKLG